MDNFMDCLVAATRFILFTLFGSTITVILLVTPCDFTEIFSFPALLQRFFLLMKPLQPMFLLTYM